MSSEERYLPRYPVYIPSKGRSDVCLTAQCLMTEGVPFRIVVEEQEREKYASLVGAESVLVLPHRNRGLYMARNWIKDHATAEGHERHWQLDDNIAEFYRVYGGERFYCDAGVALRVAEDFSDRYENVAISGLTYTMFAFRMGTPMPPFYLNVHVYSCTLILNRIPHKWRCLYNDDTDICLQVLSDGWCTVLINAFSANKMQTMKIKGGNTADLYQGDGRLKMARSLERLWPGVVSVGRRFKRPQHVVLDNWRRFDTPLKLKAGLSLEELKAQGTNEYNLRLVMKKENIKSKQVKELYDRFNSGQASPQHKDGRRKNAERGKRREKVRPKLGER